MYLLIPTDLLLRHLNTLPPSYLKYIYAQSSELGDLIQSLATLELSLPGLEAAPGGARWDPATNILCTEQKNLLRRGMLCPNSRRKGGSPEQKQVAVPRPVKRGQLGRPDIRFSQLFKKTKI